MKKLIILTLLFVGVFVKAQLSEDPVEKVKKVFNFDQTYLCTIFPLKVKNQVFGITAGHCCPPGNRYLVVILNEPLRKYALVNILGTSNLSDICKTDWPQGHTSSFVLGNEMLPGDVIRTLGFPHGEFRDRTGVFTGRYEYGLDNDHSDLLACYDLPDLQGGASGSPVLNADNQVIGIISASDGRLFAYGVTLTDIKLFLRSY